MEIIAKQTIVGNFKSVQEFRAAHPGAEIEEIDGKAYIGKCIQCGKAICEGDSYADWTDEIGCAECEAEGSARY